MGVALDGAVGECHVDPRRDGQDGTGQRGAGIAKSHSETNGEVAADRVPNAGDFVRLVALTQQPLVGGVDIFKLRREFVLGGSSIIQH